MSNGNPNNPNPNMTTSNLGLLSLLGGIGGLFNPNQNRPVTQAEQEDTRKYGQNLRDRPIPDKMSHWTQVLGAILGPLAGQYTLNRSYGMQDRARTARTDAFTQPNTNNPPPNTNNPPPRPNPGNQFPPIFRSPLVRPPYTFNNNNDDLPFQP